MANFVLISYMLFYCMLISWRLTGVADLV